MCSFKIRETLFFFNSSVIFKASSAPTITLFLILNLFANLIASRISFAWLVWIYKVLVPLNNPFTLSIFKSIIFEEIL